MNYSHRMSLRDRDLVGRRRFDDVLGRWVPTLCCCLEHERRDEDLARHKPPWTPRDHPYNYDPFTIWGLARTSELRNATLYTDRLESWCPAKYAALAHKHYHSGSNDYVRPFDSYDCQGHLIERFLRDYFADPALELLRIVQQCNPGTGEVIWRLDVHATRDLQSGAL